MHFFNSFTALIKKPFIMKRILLISGLLLSSFFPANAQIFQEDFNNNATLAGWTLHNVDGKTPSTANPNYNAIFGTSAWKVVTWNSDPGNPIVSTTSWFTPAGQADRWLVTPQITLPILTAGNTIKLTFDAKSIETSVQYQDGYTVYLSTTGTAVADFTTTLLTVPAESNVWQPKTVDLTSYASASTTKNIYLAWRNNNNDKNILHIDNVKVAIPSSCVQPTALVSSAVTSTSATASWTAPATAPALGYDFYMNTTNVTPTAATAATGSVGAGVTSTPLTLTEGLSHYIWVRSKCSASSVSDWSAKLTIVAPLTPTNVPYSYGFETNEGWTLFNAGTGNNWAITTPTGVATDPILAAAEGASYASYSWHGTNAANAWLFSRKINLVAGTTYKVTFKYRVADNDDPINSYPEKLKVTIGNDNTVAAQTDELFNNNNILVQTWTAGEGFYTAPANGTYSIGFNCYSAADMYRLGVDDVMIVAVPLSVEEVSESSFSVYPNPASNLITLSNNINVLVNNVSVTDLNGRVVKNVKVDNLSVIDINVTDLSAGMYIMTISSDKGSVVKKIMKK